MVIADEAGVLAIAGVKGGKRAEVDEHTKNIIIEVANFEPASVRKTAKSVGILTDAVKRYENDLSSELCDFAMKELCGLFVEYGIKDFEDVVDVYPKLQPVRKLHFTVSRISSILGLEILPQEMENILKRYSIEYKKNGDAFEIIVPPLRLDLAIEEDMAEEVARIIGYDKIKPEMPKIHFRPRMNEIIQKINLAYNKLLGDGYTEVMTYVFRDEGVVEVLESASDKKLLRTNLTDGLKESMKLNQANAALLDLKEVKIFEIGTIFKKESEQVHVAYANKKEIKEMSLDEFCKNISPDTLTDLSKQDDVKFKFKMWSLFPFIPRDIAIWVPEKTESLQVLKVIQENMGDLVVRGPELFDTFTKEGRTSYAYRLIFQSYERTLSDLEVNAIMETITKKMNANAGWQVR